MNQINVLKNLPCSGDRWASEGLCDVGWESPPQLSHDSKLCDLQVSGHMEIYASMKGLNSSSFKMAL